jgi:isoleucyl-tRNA synthetase
MHRFMKSLHVHKSIFTHNEGEMVCHLNISRHNLIDYVYIYKHNLEGNGVTIYTDICRDDLIDTSIERAVSRMQSVIELGRVTRERNTLPLKYPLKEVVAIHRDPEALQDIKSLQSYIMEELNVREVKVTNDKSSFGAHLVAEADFKVLGAKLKVGGHTQGAGSKAEGRWSYTRCWEQS